MKEDIRRKAIRFLRVARKGIHSDGVYNFVADGKVFMAWVTKGKIINIKWDGIVVPVKNGYRISENKATGVLCY